MNAIRFSERHWIEYKTPSVVGYREQWFPRVDQTRLYEPLWNFFLVRFDRLKETEGHAIYVYARSRIRIFKKKKKNHFKHEPDNNNSVPTPRVIILYQKHVNDVNY